MSRVLKGAGVSLLVLLAVIRPVTVAAQGRPAPTVSFTQTGPDKAAVTIVEFSDFECPFCATVPPVLQQLLAQYPNQIRFIFKHNPLSIHPNAPLAHEAALAAGVQGRFWEMHDLLFLNQKRLSRQDLIGYASQLQLDVAAFTTALDDHRFKAIVDQDATEARAFGVTGTPTFFINGQRVGGAPTLTLLKSYVDTSLGRTLPASASTESRVTRFNLEGAPSRGADEAPVTIVEFSDFQCPFCAKSVAVIDQLMSVYDGKVKLYFKNNPLSIHANAMVAHRAAMAAKEQGRFWQMHDALFANQKAVRREDFIATAQRLGLDVPRFAAAFDNPSLKQQIDIDKSEGTTLNVSGTPTFFINGRRMVGVKSFADFQSIIDQELSAPAVSATPASVGATDEPGPDVSKGAVNAPITLQWFTDLRSTLTPKAAELVKALMTAYPDQIRVVVRHRPLDSRADGRLTHEAALAAADQGKFWAFHDAVIAERGELDRQRLDEIGGRVGVDVRALDAALQSHKFRMFVERDLEDARRREVRGTPVFFVNGRRIDGIQPLTMLQRVVDEEMRRRAEK